MLKTLPKDLSEEVLRNFTLPPQPIILKQLNALEATGDPDQFELVKLIGQDVSIAAAVLKTVNAPFFGLTRRTASLMQAVQLLGWKNIITLARSAALRHALGAEHPQMATFWQDAARIAQLCSHLARCIPSVTPEEAYIYGLFENCGMALMMQRFPNYQDALKHAQTDMEFSLVEFEEGLFSASHDAIGYLLLRAWYFPDSISQAILCHHDPLLFRDPKSANDVDSRSLVGLARMASHLDHLNRTISTDREWEQIERDVLQHFHLTAIEFKDIAYKINEGEDLP